MKNPKKVAKRLTLPRRAGSFACSAEEHSQKPEASPLLMKLTAFALFLAVNHHQLPVLGTIRRKAAGSSRFVRKRIWGMGNTKAN
ncbi:MAG: hypothetical protein QF745_09895 [Planctomycetota bacterium]|jgi:hypothetical protein|nr:hypothetical protein [Planctomycetota bacterium]